MWLIVRLKGRALRLGWAALHAADRLPHPGQRRVDTDIHLLAALLLLLLRHRLETARLLLRRWHAHPLLLRILLAE